MSPTRSAAGYSRYETTVMAGLVVGVFLSALESTVVATALPSVVTSLGGQELYSLPFAVYLLASTLSGPIWGRLSDLYGRKTLYLASVAVFTVGSALCGAAGSMGFLVAMRVVQGLGAGGVMPLSLTMLADLFDLERRARAQAFFSSAWGVSGLLGPILGGLIVDVASWRWVFYLNLPFAAGAAYLISRYYRDAGTRRAARVDWLGAALFGAGTGCLVWGLETVNQGSGGVSYLLASVPLLVAFALVQARVPSPILPLRLFGSRLVALGLGGNLSAGMAYFGLIAYLPLYAQKSSGLGAAAAGAVLTPLVVAWTLASIAAARLLPRLGVRTLTVLGASILVVGFGLFRLLLGGPLVLLSLAGAVAGLGMGFTMLTLLVSVQEAVPRQELGAVTSALLFMRTVGGSIGAALMGLLIGAGLESGGPALTEGVGRAFLLAVGLALVTWVVALALPRPARAAAVVEGPPAA